MNRRQVLLGLAGAASLRAVPGSAQSDYLAELYAKAKTEGEVTWYIVYWPSERADKHAALFMRAYPGIKVNVVRATAQVAYQRLSQDLKTNTANCDVFNSTDMGHYVSLKQRGLLMPYKMQTVDQIDPRYLGVDPDDAYHIVNAAFVGIGYNTSAVKPEDAPKSWKHFIDPKWRDGLVVGHPGFSGFVGTWVVQMNKLFGWSYFEELAALKPHVGRSIIDTVTVLMSGERKVGASPSPLILRNAASGNPVAVSAPEEGSVLMVSGGAILKNTRHPNAAKLFMEFLYSRTTAGEDVEEFSLPLRRDAVLPPGLASFGDLKTIRPTIEEIVTGIPELTEKWRDTFGV